ncbi:MAG: Mrp/NBP35 family ATP-binding protein [Gemmatimonadetes bacterium]|nr:Mrp/NBP35 family ATP-binding protein [Gemmatimonadota bacterium]
MRRFRTYNQVEHDTGSGILEQVLEQRARLARRLADVRAIVAVVSGKGGVGKSAVTANLAVTLARRGLRVGALDADLNGPSLGRMLGVAGRHLGDGPDGVVPPEGAAGVRVVSMELLQDAADAPLRWRGPATDTFVWQGLAETSTLREFFSDIVWGELDVLLVDAPPGTDRIARLLELVRPDQVLLVTTPAEIARFVVAKSARLLREAGLERIGIIANMTGIEAAGETDGARVLAAETGVPIWAEIPFDTRLAASTDRGEPWVLRDRAAPAARAFEVLADRVERAIEEATA